MSRVLVAVAAATALLAVPSAAGASPPSTTASQAPLTAAAAATLSRNVDTPVIVVMKNQPAVVDRNSSRAQARAAFIGGDQAPLMQELAQVHARKVQGLHLVNAVVATVSRGEAARLAANPAVKAVVPDSVVKLQTPTIPAASGASHAAATAATPPPPPGACPAPGATMLEPEALSLTNTNSDDPAAKTARSLGATGAGVKVGIVGDAFDVANPDYIRADGSHVVANYQDFTGEGLNAPGFAAESFLEASEVAAQGRQTYDISTFAFQTLPSTCSIRIEGMAPGAQLYAYKVIGSQTSNSESELARAVDYATTVDHVDVLNVSLITDPLPAVGSLNVLKLFLDAAVKAGVTVTAPTGDAGTTSTVSSPATDPNLISVGATTSYRFNEQTNYGAARQFGSTGWVSDNVDTLSSSGFNEDGRTIDLLAPGDAGFKSCTANATLYPGCVNLRGSASNVAVAAGTSQSAPLTAGAAALVIEAYRKTHGGATPSPAEAKQILTSTADDLTVPGDEQGAGLLDSYRAVQAALSVHDANGSPAATGSSLLIDQGQLTATGLPGSQEQWTVHVTNTGASTSTVNLSGRTFGPPQQATSTTATLSDSGPQFQDWAGGTNNYATVPFTVPAGADRLDAAIAYPGTPRGPFSAKVVRLILIDPQGRFVDHSRPQGVTDYGHVDARLPTAGTWTAVIFSRVSTSGGTIGNVVFQATTSSTTGLGSVSPSSLTLAPGQTGTATVTAALPAQPGDISGSLVLNAGTGQQSSAPIILRSLVDTANGGAFGGTLTGGNGSTGAPGQANFYQFDVPAGEQDLAASVDLTNDPVDTVLAYLVGPDGLTAATGSNQVATSYDLSSRSGTLQSGTPTDLYARAPAAGRWTLIVNFATAIAGDEVSQRFTGSIKFNTATSSATAKALPRSRQTTLKAGQPIIDGVVVTNHGTQAQNYFVDPRLNTVADVQLAPVLPATLPLPMPPGAPSPSWLVPSETGAVTLAAQSTVPSDFVFGLEHGDPKLVPSSAGTTPSATFQASRVPDGLWAANAGVLGPFNAPAPSGTDTLTMTASTRPFDPNVTSGSTDLWQDAVTPGGTGAMKLVTVQPGQTATISITITPTGTKGTVVNGTIFIDTLVVGTTAAFNDLSYADTAPTEPTANEIQALPYSYTVG